MTPRQGTLLVKTLTFICELFIKSSGFKYEDALVIHVDSLIIFKKKC